jgi:hypothetical protein
MLAGMAPMEEKFAKMAHMSGLLNTPMETTTKTVYMVM